MATMRHYRRLRPAMESACREPGAEEDEQLLCSFHSYLWQYQPRLAVEFTRDPADLIALAGVCR